MNERIKDIASLFKMRLGFFVVVSAILGWFMAVDTMDIRSFLMLTIGGYLLTGASNGLNQIIEKRVDGLMTRTSNRPLPTGRMGTGAALTYSVIAGGIGLFCLFGLNPLSGWLGVTALLAGAWVLNLAGILTKSFNFEFKGLAGLALGEGERVRP